MKKPSNRAVARLPTIDDSLLQRMTDAIVEAAHPEQVILFGSRARGDARENSDIDLLVLEAEPFGPDRSQSDEQSRVERALWGFNVPLDLLVYSVEDANYWRRSLNHVIARALREGKVLYERRSVSDLELELARQLFDVAETNASAVRSLVKTPGISEELFGFHVQQAAEKLLKAWIGSNCEVFPATHDLSALLAVLGAGGADVDRFDGLGDYSRYAARLHGHIVEPGDGSLDRPKAVKQLEALVEMVRHRLAQAEAG